MNRPIKFRGKRLSNGEWVYGDLQTTNCTDEFGNESVRYEIRTFRYRDWVYFTAYPSTIGQFTGLIDKDGNRIFEGDIIAHGSDLFVIEWDGVGFYLKSYCDDADGVLDLSISSWGKVIGNIHDNPELLKGGEI